MAFISIEKKLLGLGLVFASSIAAAAPAYVIIPNCLAQKVTISAEEKAKGPNHKLFTVAQKDLQKLALSAHKVHCGGFLNVTQRVKQGLASSNYQQVLQDYTQTKPSLVAKDNYKISHHEEVEDLIKAVEPNNIWATLEHLSKDYNDRYANSKTGVATAQWIKDNFDKMAKDAGRVDVNSYFVETGWYYEQPSVVTLIGKKKPGAAIVVGAHMDTLQYNKPGADDDGSGSSSLTEVTRVLLNSKQDFNRPIYLVWYAAEELGLYGSQYVVDDFKKKNIAVDAVLQMDMTGFRRNGSDKIWMIGDHVNQELSEFVAELIKTYVGVDVGWSRCGYACSDHASWTYGGFKSAFPVETKFGEENPYIHTSKDTMEHVSLDHMANFSRLALAFVGELAAK
jgi:bacterial leucyl aminopeptidase